VSGKEAMELQPGDILLHCAGRPAVTVVVVKTHRFGWDTTEDDPAVTVITRRPGLKKNGARYPERIDFPKYLTLVERPTPATKPVPHVYADYLEEKGFDEAAKVLRQAFPME
jgi:hypothetical protein